MLILEASVVSLCWHTGNGVLDPVSSCSAVTVPGSVQWESRGPSVACLQPCHPAFFIGHKSSLLLCLKFWHCFSKEFADSKNSLQQQEKQCFATDRHHQPQPLLLRFLQDLIPPQLCALAAALGNSNWSQQGVKKCGYVDLRAQISWNISDSSWDAASL